jgi:hypothetical protein
MRPSRFRRPAAALVLLLACASIARGQEKVGSAAALEGKAEVLHRGATAWLPLAAGDPVFVGDQVRTLADSKLKIVFQEDSVLSLAASSTLAVTEQTAAPAPVSSFSLLLGTLKAIVTERYSEPRARFEVETPTAIAGVRGTGFIATYDPAKDETLVVGLYDTTRVRSTSDAKGAHAVDLGPGKATRVRRGQFPLSPKTLPEDQLHGLEGATGLASGGTSPTHELAPAHRGADANETEAKKPLRSGDKAITHEGQVIPHIPTTDTGKKPPPPPPPVR